ncbi:hypothetical protein LEN26_017454 [Aphanomyces euteiches]|nr:hypothetical protein LEN26_017454 [Aphanomyces euteiches]KAH9127850.1 hypothetical protein AeMF1_001926 [Aphanomyces euteiches]KAH9191736.1 hypothetical protein AeNC1_006284 [Aphanomyces euteiches]
MVLSYVLLALADNPTEAAASSFQREYRRESSTDSNSSFDDARNDDVRSLLQDEFDEAHVPMLRDTDENESDVYVFDDFESNV